MFEGVDLHRIQENEEVPTDLCRDPLIEGEAGLQDEPL
jgi:hypothetical protein